MLPPRLTKSLEHIKRANDSIWECNKDTYNHEGNISQVINSIEHLNASLGLLLKYKKRLAEIIANKMQIPLREL